ncbi:MAG: 4-(cytidine 5'-diphospho)-2-C-methyl-D-erythritol kinase [Actinobacteria bacterium]|jgi:4-diphosphocytidyl-2-C-methyl-D-erythritol kinase|nr:MAG: 4-(cytidine 5'-diphospho)-2-C-methyl-D-erythritol kinase [Actinomycetota bacterium]
MRSQAVLEAPAKINLYLEAGPPRPDGYHPVRTVLQTVELCDLVEMEVTDGGEGLYLAVEGGAPSGEDNLCHRAAAVFLATTGLRMGIKIRLVKRIPQAAGLGGGSSDAAAVLRILNFLSGEALSREELFRTAATLGMDVPFFLVGGTALGEGRGERITPLPQAPPLPVLLVNPGAALTTGDVYRRYDLSGGDDPPAQGPDSLIAFLPAGDAGLIGSLLYNSLQRAACELMPEVGSLLEWAAAAGAAGALVSGSGPTVFVLAAGDEEAASLEGEMRRHAPLVVRTSFRMAGVSQVG